MKPALSSPVIEVTVEAVVFVTVTDAPVNVGVQARPRRRPGRQVHLRHRTCLGIRVLLGERRDADLEARPGRRGRLVVESSLRPQRLSMLPARKRGRFVCPGSATTGEAEGGRGMRGNSCSRFASSNSCPDPACTRRC